MKLRYGAQDNAPVAQTIWARHTELYHAYDTNQKIDPLVGVKGGEGFQYLSAWHLRGRYLTWWEMNRGFLVVYTAVGLILGVLGHKFISPIFTSRPAIIQLVQEDKYSATVFGRGYYLEGSQRKIILSDGRTVTADAFKETATGWQALVGDLWYKGDAK